MIYLLFLILVFKPTNLRCSKSLSILASTSPKYIASLITKETGCGLTDTPLMIDSAKGQQINFTIINFNWDSNSRNESKNACGLKYGYLFDVQAEQVVNICGVNHKKKALYTSTGNQVQVLLDAKELQDHYFLIKYQGW